MSIRFTRHPHQNKEEEHKAGEQFFTREDIHDLIDKKLNVSVKQDVVKSFIEPRGEKPVKADGNIVPVNYTEKVSSWNWNKAIMYFTILGIMGILFFTMFMKASPAFLLLTWLFGTLCFIPLGLVIGWLFLNPDIRVLILRRMRGKNYGIVHFVHPGGQRMVTRIKNFDDDIIIQDTKMWILHNDGIYYMDRNRNMLLHSKIESQHIKTMPANIPVLYLDSNSMIPLTFNSTPSDSNPQQVGATVLGYIYNQLAKALFMKKGLQMFFIIVIILTIINLVVGIQMAIWMQEMHEEIPRVEALITRLGEIVNSGNYTSNLSGMFPLGGG